MTDNTFELKQEAKATDAFAYFPATRRRLEIPVARLPTQTMISLPVTVVHGIEPGPKLWLSAAIHGDELNGVEIIHQVLSKVNPQELRGTLIAVPVVNVFGFIEQSRYLPDRRDLNRSFPGSATGSLASRLACLFMKEIVSRCTHGIDLHTASHHRINLPQIRANLDDSETYRCAKAFGAPIIIHATTRDGSLRQAATRRGIPILLYEAGEALRFDPEAIRVGVEGILRVMNVLEMYSVPHLLPPKNPQEVSESKWIRASRSGILHLKISLGDFVDKKQILCSINDAFGETSVKIRAGVRGIVIGHTQNPLVNQGDGIVHLAIVQ
ncbi:succinylglutamate desuccinylase/aspartoacylase family protein [Oscillatoria salina]|uniref:succinylglutamate desuccinylase/aspartoacylase family protein n=1 Tax=Oscillatoria salina TaxID=331517 RepID=UPI00296207DF|nr:succinylglutamate desuccinylase/aspartoacylase family protein [Oscillatoria salina]